MLDAKHYGFVFTKTEIELILMLLDGQTDNKSCSLSSQDLGACIQRTEDTLAFWQGKDAPVITTADLEGA